MFSHHNQVKAQIDQFLDIITRYHTSDDLLRRAEQLVPISDLLERIPDLNTDNNDDFRESLLPLVADWFSEDFFTWYDQPECQECPNSPEMNQIVRRRRGDIMVEYYQCPNYANCKQASEFARHNDPGILLETRTGRCGEWANCFYLILRSLDFDARLVVDFTDHVWCEVWSERRQCWLHVNPGEGAIDQPLMYEAGWKKNLTYCIAFSPFEVQDVTWRYVIDLKQTCSRRNLCDEDWLARYLVICTEKLICGCSETFKDMIRKRKLLELLSFIRTPENYIRKVTADDLVQRKTGSLAWRVARGEFSTQMSCHNIVAIKTIDTNLIRHSKSTIYTMRYNCCKDVYTCTYNQSTTKPSWLSLVYEAKNVARKFEKDWKIAYIVSHIHTSFSKSVLDRKILIKSIFFLLLSITSV